MRCHHHAGTGSKIKSLGCREINPRRRLTSVPNTSKNRVDGGERGLGLWHDCAGYTLALLSHRCHILKSQFLVDTRMTEPKILNRLVFQTGAVE